MLLVEKHRLELLGIEGVEQGAGHEDLRSQRAEHKGFV